LKNETPDSTSILTSNKEPEGIQKGVYKHPQSNHYCTFNEANLSPLWILLLWQ